ncbi:hypothetical protein [Klebsiella pneumoniae]|uniref:hypothetical protein n=1 Tax=Klebsiella pneumoniae TaxID=573 RepID=UPI001D0EC734|nr:hypothetical protein [Klebsiella pneumoniae]
MTVRLYYNAVDRRAQASNEWHAEWPGKSLETEGSEKSRSDTRFQNMAGTTSRMAGCAG